MGCPRSTELELRVTGRLSDEASRSLDQHLDTCADCQQELGFLQALRLSVAARPSQAPTRDHLSDEQLAALADGVMDEGQREQAMAHLADCSDCASGLAAIERAMDEAQDPDGQPVMAPPTQLLNRAIRIGAPGRSASAQAQTAQDRPGLLDRLFGAPLLLRLGVAAGVAALILALTVVLSQPTPAPTGEAGGPKADEPKVADAPKQAPADPTLAPALQPDRPDQPAPVVAEGPTDAPAPSAPAPSDHPTDAVPEPPPSRDWLAALDPNQRAGLAEQARPEISRPGKDLGQGQALAEPSAAPGMSDGYVIGRALGFLERFGPHVGKSAELRGLVSETLLSLEPAIRTALPQGEQADRLVDFAAGLGGQLAAGQIAADAAGRRLQVFCVALREALSGQASIRSGLQLGLLVQGWQTTANADQLGIEVSLQDAAALKRARLIIRTDQGLNEQMRRSVLSDLSQVTKARRQRHGKQRAARILEEISRLDQRVRSVR